MQKPSLFFRPPTLHIACMPCHAPMQMPRQDRHAETLHGVHGPALLPLSIVLQPYSCRQLRACTSAQGAARASASALSRAPDVPDVAGVRLLPHQHEPQPRASALCPTERLIVHARAWHRNSISLSSGPRSSAGVLHERPWPRTAALATTLTPQLVGFIGACVPPPEPPVLSRVLPELAGQPHQARFMSTLVACWSGGLIGDR